MMPIAMPTSASVDEPPPDHVHVEIEAQAEIAGDETSPMLKSPPE